jgi:hypothetical protein
MKRIYAALIALPVVCFLGCNETGPGGPNATKPREDKSSVDRTHETTGIGTAENTFKLSLPTFDTGIKQGERKTVRIGITRGKNFDQDVDLEFGKIPAGITATPAKAVLARGEKDVQVIFEASQDAALGEQVVSVSAKPAKEGAPTTGKITLEVKKP